MGERPHEQHRVERRRVERPGTGQRGGVRDPRLAPEQTDPLEGRRSASRSPASRCARYRMSRARSSASGSVPSSARAVGSPGRLARQHRAALDQDQLAGDRDERADIAEPVDLERRERVEIGVGQRAERDRQDVELARLDERQEQGERPVELGDLDLGRGLRPAPLAELDAGRGAPTP